MRFRSRVAALVVAVMAAVVGLAVPAASAVSMSATSAQEMNARTAQIAGLGDLFDGLRTERLPDGRWLSFTGDATAQPGQVWPVYDNAAVIWDAAGQRRVQPPGGGHFFPRWDDGSEFWPLQFHVTGAGRVYVLGARVKTYDGAYNWSALGAYGAVVDVPAGADPRFLAYFPTPSSLLDDSVVQWNGAIASDGSWLYVHGVRDRPEAYHARDGGYVARAKLDHLEVPHRWQVWVGWTWSSRVDQAVPTIPVWGDTTNGTSSAYTLHRRPNGQWQVTTKRAGDLADQLGRYTGPTPWGPWTWEPLLTVCPLDCYLAGAAPSIPTASGNLLVQWSRTGSSPVWAEVSQ